VHVFVKGLPCDFHKLGVDAHLFQTVNENLITDVDTTLPYRILLFAEPLRNINMTVHTDKLFSLLFR
jgi:hypothetical protein